MQIIENSTHIKVYMSPEAYEWMKLVVGACETEVAWLGSARVKADEANAFEVYGDFYIPEQEVTSGSVTASNTMIQSILEKDFKGKEDAFYTEFMPNQKFWGHSHVNMGTFWSTVDESGIRSLSNSSFLISLVTNKAGSVLVRVDLFKPIRVAFNSCKLEITGKKELPEELKQLLDDRLIKKDTTLVQSGSSYNLWTSPNHRYGRTMDERDTFDYRGKVYPTSSLPSAPVSGISSPPKWGQTGSIITPATESKEPGYSKKSWPTSKEVTLSNVHNYCNVMGRWPIREAVNLHLKIKGSHNRKNYAVVTRLLLAYAVEQNIIGEGPDSVKFADSLETFFTDVLTAGDSAVMPNDLVAELLDYLRDFTNITNLDEEMKKIENLPRSVTVKDAYAFILKLEIGDGTLVLTPSQQTASENLKIDGKKETSESDITDGVLYL